MSREVVWLKKGLTQRSEQKRERLGRGSPRPVNFACNSYSEGMGKDQRRTCVLNLRGKPARVTQALGPKSNATCVQGGIGGRSEGEDYRMSFIHRYNQRAA